MLSLWTCNIGLYEHKRKENTQLNIAAALIVKDDSELTGLTTALDSIQPYVESVYVTVTGKQVDKIKFLCKKRGINYSYFKWVDDFSAARNFNFAQVKQPVDYIFWMDADDVLIGGEKLKEVAAQAKTGGKDVVFFTYWYGCEFTGEPSPSTFKAVQLEHNRERLIRPGTHLWKGRLHETPVPVPGAKNNYTKYIYSNEQPIVVMHLAPESGLAEKMARNQRILELQLTDERTREVGADPRTLLYLMKIYAEKDIEADWQKVLEMGAEYLTKSGWNEERAVCYEQMAVVSGKLGDQAQAAKYLHQAISEWPHQPLLYVRLATAYFNLQNYGFAEYWAGIGANMNIDNGGSNLTNIKAMKLMYAELLLKLNYNAKKDTKKALEAAKLLFQELATQENAQQVAFLEDINSLNEACGNVDKLCGYLQNIGNPELIAPILDSLPIAINSQPFALKLRQQFAPPRIWGADEICYFANFGGKHFEEWSGKSLAKGIGGSETAVIELSKRWTKMGYKVTVYGDPGADKGDIDGVTYLPWYYFNHKDSFNIFIQWRTPQLAGKVKAKKFLVDMHDIYNEIDFVDKMDQIDAIMVKSDYHRNLSVNIPQEKFQIIGNGI